MKNIAVFAYNFTVEYATSVLKGIFRYFEEDSDARVFYVQTKLPHTEAGFFEYQYWAATEFVKSNFIDEILIISNSYFYYTDREDFLKLMKPFLSKKTVSIGTKIEGDTVYYTSSSCYDVYDELVWHLKNIHGCKKFAFFSADQISSSEAVERYEAYKKALEKNGLEFDEKLVFSGRFTASSAKEELERKIKGRDDVNFDALLCANDLMAIGAVDYMTSIGVMIPSDLKIAGYDNTSHASLCMPPLTTIDPSIEQQGFEAAKFGMNILTSHVENHSQKVPLCVRYRNSCGCATAQGIKNMEAYSSLLSYYNDISHIDLLFDFIRGVSSLQDFAESYRKINYFVGFSLLTACMYEEPFAVGKDEMFNALDSMKLIMYLNADDEIYNVYEDGRPFNPQETLLPPEFDDKIDFPSGQFIFQPIFLGELQYGYIICRMRQNNFALNGVVLKLISSMLAQAYDYTKTLRHSKTLENANQELQDNNSSLRIKSRTDELTGILNRRGFMENGQKVISFAVEIDMTGLVFFADLDGLKKINDNYGHEYGDIAIKLQAQILKEAFRQTDTVGRLSGDEFGIISVGMKTDYVDVIRKKIEDLDRFYSEENNLPFTLSISVGFAKFTPQKRDIESLLKEADQNLYEQKEIHHARQK